MSLFNNNDKLSDISEIENGTDPYKQDTDSDGYSDDEDIFPLDSKEWIDLDEDGIGDNKDTFPSISRYQTTSDLVVDVLLVSIILGVIPIGIFALYKRK